MKSAAVVGINFPQVVDVVGNTQFGIQHAGAAGARIRGPQRTDVPRKVIAAQAEGSAQAVRQVDLEIRVCPDAELIHLVAPHRGKPGSFRGIEKIQLADPVEAGISADDQQYLATAPRQASFGVDPPTDDPAAVFLLDLVAVHWIVQEVGWIAEQIESILCGEGLVVTGVALQAANQVETR